MRTTIDIPDPMLRQVKSKCALEGRTMRGVTMLFFQDWLAGGSASMQILDAEPMDIAPQSAKEGAKGMPPHDDMPPWFGIVKVDPNLPHDMESIRASIAKGRAAEWAERERRIREGVE